MFFRCLYSSKAASVILDTLYFSSAILEIIAESINSVGRYKKPSNAPIAARGTPFGR